jgi:hypothetical protein
MQGQCSSQVHMECDKFCAQLISLRSCVTGYVSHISVMYNDNVILYQISTFPSSRNRIHETESTSSLNNIIYSVFSCVYT